MNRAVLGPPLKDKIKWLEAEIKELKEGACRYHCRTAKKNYMAGFNDGQSALLYNDNGDAQEAWNERNTDE